MKGQEDWLKFKKYPHIGKPLTKKNDGNWVRKYVMTPERIATHKFVPLIHRSVTQRKFRPTKDAEKNASGKRTRTVGEKKVREIYFASHLDSIIYGYYSYILTTAYENYLKDKPFGQSAVAYRKIPIEEGKIGNKSNIEFAYEAFRFIEDNRNRKLSVIVADVTSFFDNLDHRLLHSQWKRILCVDNLPNDHYALYKNVISKTYVNENELFKRFQHRLMVERFKPHDTSKTEVKRKNVKKIYNIKREKVVAFCDNEEFFKYATDLIRYDKPQNTVRRILIGKEQLKGIPQGTPISATLANIYMLDFDEVLFSAASHSSKVAFYQRYSDDIIIVCDQKDEDYFYRLIQDEIENRANLQIQPRKTNVYRYQLDEDSMFTGGLVTDGVINPNKQLEYLGFNYNGAKVYVKSAGFSKFHRTMKRSFKRGAHFARKKHIPSDALYETRLYKRFTHIGAKRRLRWLPDNESPTGYKRSTQYDWGNFISYLNKANIAMKEINNDDTIKRQYRKVWKRFHLIKHKTYKDIKNN